MIVEAAVNRSGVDDNIGVQLMQHCNALGSGNKAHQANGFAACFLDDANTLGSGAAGCKHGVNNDHIAFGGIAGQLAVIADRLERLGVAIKPDMSDFCSGNQLHDALCHAETGAENGNDAEFASCKHSCAH